MEGEEIRRSSGGFRPRRSWELHALCFFFAFGGALVQSGELTVLKPRKITRDSELCLSDCHQADFGDEMLRFAECGIYETFLEITCVLPGSTVANYKQYYNKVRM